MSDSMHELSQSNIEFGVDLVKKLSASDPNSNIFFSPMSISLALAMTSMGAKGKTESEMKSVLRLDKLSESNVHTLFKQLISQLISNTKENYSLHIANKLYGDKCNSFLDEFLGNCKEYYGTGLEVVDFKNETKECEQLINKWVEDQTNSKIKNLITPGVLSSSTQIVLINAIYFKGFWMTPFNEAATKEDSFFTSENNSTKIPLMHFYKKKFNYYFHEDLKCQVLELPYEGQTLAYITILPDLSKTNLDDVERSLNGEVLQNISSSFEKKDVNVWIPRFKLESEPEILTKLQEIGMVDLFDSRADLSAMNGARNLFISSILHKAFIEVNEKGSEAAASTAVVANKKSAPVRLEPVDFRADHPFIFLIKDIKSGSVLFLGKFLKP